MSFEEVGGGHVFQVVGPAPAEGGGGAGTGDIDGVTAGAGLLGGGTSGVVTLAVGAGTGITVSADAVAVNTAVIATVAYVDAAVAGGGGGGGVALGDTPTWTGTHTWEVTDAATTTVTDVLTVSHLTSGAAAAGYGTAILMRGENAGGTTEDMARLQTTWLDPAAGSEDSRFTVQLRSAGGALANVASFDAASVLFSPALFTIGNGSYTFNASGTSIVHGLANSRFGHTFSRTAPTTGAYGFFLLTPGNSTGQTASIELSNFVYSAHSRQWATGALATQREWLINAPTYTFVGASVITDAATFAITGAPIASTNATITNSYALWVQSGTSRFDGDLLFTDDTSDIGAVGARPRSIYASTDVWAGANFRHGTGAATDWVLSFAGARTNYTTVAASGNYGHLFNQSGVAGSGAHTFFRITPNNYTGQTAGTEVPGFLLDAHTRQWATGAIATQREVRFSAPTYSFVGASVITDAATFAITGAPIAGVNATITNSYALWVQNGMSRFDGVVSAEVTDAATNTTTDALVLGHRTSGTAAVSFGTGILMRGQDAAGNTDDLARVSAYYTDPTSTSEDTAFGVQVRTSGVALATVLTVSGLQVIAFPQIFNIGGNNYAINTSGVTATHTLGASRFIYQYSRTAPTSSAYGFYILSPGNSSGQTASTELSNFVYSTHSRQWATGAIATQREWLINAPTYTFVGASVITEAATFAITGAPIAGVNATITNSYAFWVQGGTSRFEGDIIFTDNTADIGKANATRPRHIYAAGDVWANVSLYVGTGATSRIQIYNASGQAMYRALSTAFGHTFIANAITTGAHPFFSIQPSSNTGQTTGTEISNFVNLSYSRQWATGAIATQREWLINAPTYTFVGASVITNATTFAITGAPIAGVNATITNAYAFWVQGGLARFDGDIMTGGHVIPTATGTTDLGTATLKFRNFYNSGTVQFGSLTASLLTRGSPNRAGIEAASSSYVYLQGFLAAGNTTEADVVLGADNPRTAGWVVQMAHNMTTGQVGTRLWGLKFDGRVFQATPNAAPTDADLQNGETSLYVDQAANTLIARVKYSDGTLKTGTIALA